jgi:branched chain amino acid efflux pump
LKGPWEAILVVALVAVGLRAAGVVIVRKSELPQRVLDLLTLLPAALLAALVVTQVFVGRTEVRLDERAVGLAAAAVAIRLRLPLPITLLIAAGVTAAIRSVRGSQPS